MIIIPDNPPKSGPPKFKLQRAKLKNDQYTWLVLNENDFPVQPIQTYLHYLTNVERSPNTIRAYANHLKLYWTFLADQDIDWTSIKLSELGEFIHWLRLSRNTGEDGAARTATRTESTVNTILAAVSSFYSFHNLQSETDISLTTPSVRSTSRQYKPFLYHLSQKNMSSKHKSKANPAIRELSKLKQLKSKSKALQTKQVQALLDACVNKRDYFLIRLLYETGMRIGQALGLHHKDIKSWDNEIQVIRRAQNINGALSKQTSPHVIHVTPELMTTYTDYVADVCANLDSEFVFICLKGPQKNAPLTYRAVRDLFERLSKKIGYSVTPHMLRHTHATQLVCAGWDGAYVQKRLGHSDIQTTMNTYVHLDDRALKQAFHTYQQYLTKMNNVIRSK